MPAQGSATPRPVMVWLHGGGFSSGAGSEFDPSRLAVRGGVAVVTVDFRLGVLANLALPGMTDAGSYGLQDQRAALRWVQRNAASFGGDARNVTLFGQSGGAVAVCGQLVSPAANGLFAKAVMQSGSCATTLTANAAGPGSPASGTFWRPLATAQASSTAAAASLGCREAADRLSCLRRTPVSALLTQSDKATGAAWGTSALPADPVSAGVAQPGRPVLSGTAHDEQRFIAGTFALLQQPITAAKYPGLLASGFGSNAAAVAAEYPLSAYDSAAYAWAAAYTDSGYVCPQLETNERLDRRDPVIGYEFDDPTAPPAIPVPAGFDSGASHASELFYLFDLTTGPISITGKRYGLTAQQRDLAGTMIDAWAGFARTAQPGPSGLWPSWNRASTVHQFTAHADAPKLAELSTEHHCSFWRTHR